MRFHFLRSKRTRAQVNVDAFNEYAKEALSLGDNMNIRIERGPDRPGFRFLALHEDTYDYDQPIGSGDTEAAAMADLQQQLRDLEK